MKPADVLRQRLHNQRLEGPAFATPAEVVQWLGAVQSQDYNGAAWAVIQRTGEATLQDFNDAFARGDILRTHVLRPTWHFVAQQDIGWMLQLSAPRIRALSAYYFRKLGLDESAFAKAHDVLIKALEGGAYRTRDELRTLLLQSGLGPDTSDHLRFTYIIGEAELSGLICSGPLRGKQHTYALMCERAPHRKVLGHEEALTQLAGRYFTSHGPATAADFTWWSGLTAHDARVGLAAVQAQLASEKIAGEQYWFRPHASLPVEPRANIHLLPNYDEYIVAYANRSELFDAMHAAKLDARQNFLFNNTIILNGRIAGTWKRVLVRRKITVETNLFISLTPEQHSELTQCIERFERCIN